MERELPSAETLIRRWVGRTITTVTGKPNRVLAVDGDDALVATERSPGGRGVSLAAVQRALDMLAGSGQVTIDVPTLGRRSAFCGAVVKTIAGVRRGDGTPPRLVWREGWSPVDPRDAKPSLNTWWDGDPAERYWMEITDRPDIGTDLHCPQRDARGRANAGYSTILAVRDGDVVFHYDRNERAVTAWSQAVGEPGVAPTQWVSHRGATRRRLGPELREQPGWWLDLEGPFLVDPPVSLEHLRTTGGHILEAIDDLAGKHGSLYAPFYGYGADRELRPTQYYLNKLPATLVPLINGQAAETRQVRGPTRAPGVSWRQPVVNESHGRRLEIEVDVETVERGLRGHVYTETAVASALRAQDLEPLSPAPGDPNFDIAWSTDDGLTVAEIKSLTDRNEERQLRLGLGQLLRYRTQLAARTGLPVQALLVPERAPSDPSWADVCAAVDVVLMAGDELSRQLEAHLT